jgi:hypothetical protein
MIARRRARAARLDGATKGLHAGTDRPWASHRLVRQAVGAEWLGRSNSRSFAAGNVGAHAASLSRATSHCLDVVERRFERPQTQSARLRARH